MATTCDTIAVGWEFEVPLSEVAEARVSLERELEAHYHAPVAALTDLDVARYLVRTAQPVQRYLRADTRLRGRP